MTGSTNHFWEKAYQTNIGRLVGICYRYTRNVQLSEDLAHDAFLKAIDKSGTFTGKGPFEAWLRRIAVNHTLQYLRDRKKEPSLVDVMPDDIFPHPIEDNIDPISAQGFTCSELMAIIDQLPTHHRLVFNLYVLDNFTHAQIGETLGISEGTSKSHLARARKKLQQLLTLQAEDKQQETAHKKALLFLLVSNDNDATDHMFRELFDRFSIPPQHPLSLKSIPRNDQHTFRPRSFFKSTVNILSLSAITCITLIIVLVVIQKITPVSKQMPTEHVAIIQKTDSAAAEKFSTSIPAQTATISPGSVLLQRNLKQTPMKPLDSLALMLVLSSGPLHDAITKDPIEVPIEKYSQTDPILSADTSIAPLPLTVAHLPNTVQKNGGTFSASALYWSENDKELFFKGKVRVDFPKQHFQGKGSFTFLGKVHLLIVDGQQVAAGKTIKLTDGNYDLTTLNSTEATQKYGDKGIFGAVEIARNR